MADFLLVGGVKIRTAAGSWSEREIEIGDIADGPEGLAMTGRPIESTTALVRIWSGTTPPNLAQLDGVVAASAPAYWEALKRWVRGWGQCWPCDEGSGLPISGAGVVLGPAANLAWSGGGVQVLSGQAITVDHRHIMHVRRGFSPTQKPGWSLIFKRTFVAGETHAAGVHWCVATGQITYNQGTSANPVGITQYVDGAPANFNVGNITQIDTDKMRLFGKKTDAANAAIVFSDVAFLPFQIPASWVTQIWTNIINAGYFFPVLPRQRLAGQWLTHEEGPVDVLGRILNISQRTGSPGGQALQHDLRELELQFTEA